MHFVYTPLSDNYQVLDPIILSYFIELYTSL